MKLFSKFTMSARIKIGTVIKIANKTCKFKLTINKKRTEITCFNSFFSEAISFPYLFSFSTASFSITSNKTAYNRNKRIENKELWAYLLQNNIKEQFYIFRYFKERTVFARYLFNFRFSSLALIRASFDVICKQNNKWKS